MYDLSSPKLYGAAVRVVSNREWAEDVLQEAFLTIWRIAGDYKATPLAAHGLDGLDRQEPRPGFSAPPSVSDRADLMQELDDELSDTVAGDSPNPMDTTQASEQAWALHQCLDKLEQKQREVVSLAYLRDLSHSELAEQLKLLLGTVKTWIRRGLEQLRGCMARFA